jgi:class 3 adenylate cyclase
MSRCSRFERTVSWAVLGLALVVAGLAASDAWRQVGQTTPGFALMENRLVGIGSLDRAGLKPLDEVLAINGRAITSGAEAQAEAARAAPGTPIRYTLRSGGQTLEVAVTTERVTRHDFHQFLVEGLLPGLVFLALGAMVFWLKPGLPESRLFLGFCLIWFVILATYGDAHCTYRFTQLFLTAWALSPAVYVHLALTFPQRRTIAKRHRWIIWVSYAVAAPIALILNYPPSWIDLTIPPAIGAAYWGLALVALILSLARSSVAGSTALVRQHARVLAAGFMLGHLLPVLGTASEAVFRVSIPGLQQLWKLDFLFPVAVAYAIVRYQLFDIRAVLRLGTIYSTVTGLLVLAYVGALTGLNLAFTELEMWVPPVVPALVGALAVVLFLNPLFRLIQRLVDRTFYRERASAQQAVERLAEAMTTVLDLRRIVALITRTIDDVLHPRFVRVLLADDGLRHYRSIEPGERSGGGVATIEAGEPLLECFGRHRVALTRERLRDDPDLAALRERCLTHFDRLGVDLVVPIYFHEALTALLALGPKRSGTGYTTDELSLLQLLVHQSAVAFENAKAYTALQHALRRVEILESIRAGLAKFVPRRVQELIEQAPEAPLLAKRDVDVSVLFVDVVGYTRLAERLDPVMLNRLIERYFGAFLDEILARGGDVNETAGDGLMLIFQGDDPRRHAEDAVRTALAILRRASEISGELVSQAEPVRLHIGVNSGVAGVGATKIEGTAGTRWTYTASGQVTNLAARLAALGDGDAVLVGPETSRRLDAALAAEDLGEQRLKNVEETVRVFRIALNGTNGDRPALATASA